MAACNTPAAPRLCQTAIRSLRLDAMPIQAGLHLPSEADPQDPAITSTLMTPLPLANSWPPSRTFPKSWQRRVPLEAVRKEAKIADKLLRRVRLWDSLILSKEETQSSAISTAMAVKGASASMTLEVASRPENVSLGTSTTGTWRRHRTPRCAATGITPRATTNASQSESEGSVFRRWPKLIAAAAALALGPDGEGFLSPVACCGTPLRIKLLPLWEASNGTVVHVPC